jgi:hypothetical protein
MGAPSMLGFRLEQTFFGFKPADRVSLHENIFNMIWWGEGRWDWDTIYTMPIFLRRFWMKKINKILSDKEAADAERAEQIKSARSRKKTIR